MGLCSSVEELAAPVLAAVLARLTAAVLARLPTAVPFRLSGSTGDTRTMRVRLAIGRPLPPRLTTS